MMAGPWTSLTKNCSSVYLGSQAPTDGWFVKMHTEGGVCFGTLVGMATVCVIDVDRVKV